MAPFARRRAPIYVAAAFFGLFDLGADDLRPQCGCFGEARYFHSVTWEPSASLRGRKSYSCSPVEGANALFYRPKLLSLLPAVSSACSVGAGLHCLAVSRRAAA